MNRPWILVMVVLMAAALPLGAQSASSRAAPNPAVGPGEPEIIMPQVILNVEDLSVEDVTAQLPPEEDLLPPVRTIPVLNEGDLAVGEPLIPAPPVETEGPSRPANERVVSSDVLLGAGTLNMISGSVSLKTLGPDPRFSLQFQHETLDGFDGHDPGAGFSTRTDGLDGGLSFNAGGVGTKLAGRFNEKETGLQGMVVNGSPIAYSSALSRDIGGSATFTGSPLDWLTLTGVAAGGFDSLTLQSTTPRLSSGLSLSPSLTAQAKFGVIKVGVESDYWYRQDTYLLDKGDQLHRVKLGATFSVDLPATFVVQAAAGWFWNSDGLSLFPFSVAVTGTPIESLTLSVEGGYKVVPYDMHDIMAANELALPKPLVDDRGWYADSSARLSITRDLSATVGASVMESSALPVGSTSPDPVTGLFAVEQGSARRLSLNSGLRWALTQSISLSAGWNHEFLDRPLFTPTDAITAGILAIEPAGRFGGGVTVQAGPIADGTLQQPVLHASAFWKVIEAVKLQVDGDDLLAPLIGGGRWVVSRDTYVAPGFRLSVSVGMSL